MSRITRIMLVEDNSAYRAAIEVSLREVPELELIGQYGTAELALNHLQYQAGKVSPNLILLDLKLPGMSGLEAIPWLKKLAPDAEIIVLTQSDGEADIVHAISAGASGYLLKSASIEQIKDGIANVMDGGGAIGPDVARLIMNTIKRNPQEEVLDGQITTRESEVLKLLADGLVKKEIGDRLGISSSTVRSHIKNIYAKLDVNNAPAAIDRAHRTGLFRKWLE